MHLATGHGPCICLFDNLGSLGNPQNPYDIVLSKYSVVWDGIGLKPALSQVHMDHAQARTSAGLCGPSTERDSDGKEES